MPTLRPHWREPGTHTGFRGVHIGSCRLTGSLKKGSHQAHWEVVYREVVFQQAPEGLQSQPADDGRPVLVAGLEAGLHRPPCTVTVPEPGTWAIVGPRGPTCKTAIVGPLRPDSKHSAALSSAQQRPGCEPDFEIRLLRRARPRRRRRDSARRAVLTPCHKAVRAGGRRPNI